MGDDGLTAFLNAEPESAGDTGGEPTPTDAPQPTATDTEGQQPPADTAPAATGDDEALFNSAEFLQQHPELEPYAKQLQADYTRKTQSLAEQRKALEGLHEGDLNWLRTWNDVAARSPQAAAQMLDQVKQELLGQSAAIPVEQDPEGWDLMTDTERQLAQELRQVKSEVQQFVSQQRLASDQALVRQQLDGLEAELGVSIPYEQRVVLWNEMQREGIPVSYAARMWKAAQGWEHARRLGREEGAKSVQAKQSLPAAPSGIANRSEIAPPNKARTLEEHLEQELAGQ